MTQADLDVVLLEDQTHAQRKRLAFIDFCLQYHGSVGRSDLMRQFGTAVASCTRDIALYRELAPGNLILRHDSKRYYRTDHFQPLFNHDTDVALRNLLHGFDGLSVSRLAPGYCEDSPNLIAPPLTIVATLSRAITLGQAIKIHYQSLSSGKTERTVVPHRIVNNGQRWHVRGYCRLREQFRDFVCTRITDIGIDNTAVMPHEQLSADAEWNLMLTLDLVPHPGHPYPDGIVLDYAMHHEDNPPVRRIQIQAARAGYLLRHWQVDCSLEHRLPANEYPLWLANNATYRNSTYPLTNMMLAPGFAAEPADHSTR